MKHINNYLDFKKIYEISVGPVGPAYGDTRVQNKTLDGSHTAVIYCELDGNFYTRDEYNNLYTDYLKMGGGPLFGFSLKNIEIILQYNKKI
jgi:hypothetical protein